MKKPIRLVNKKIKNTRDTDIYVRDVYGKEHIIYPQEEKILLMMKKTGG